MKTWAMLMTWKITLPQNTTKSTVRVRATTRLTPTRELYVPQSSFDASYTNPYPSMSRFVIITTVLSATSATANSIEPQTWYSTSNMLRMRVV